MSETLEEQIKRKTATSYKLMEVPNTISLEELNIIYNNKKKYYEGNARKLSSLDVAYDLIKKDRGFVSSAASNAAAGSSAAASAARNAALKEEIEHVMRLLLGESSPQSKQQEQKSNFYSAFRGTAKARSSAASGTFGANKQENRQNQSSNKNKNKNKKEKEAFALFGTTKKDLEKLSVEEAKKKINKVFRIEALKYHPDKATGNEEEFKKWSTAKDLIDIIMGWETKNEKREGGTRKIRKN